MGKEKETKSVKERKRKGSRAAPVEKRRGPPSFDDPVAEYNYQQAKFKDISGQVSNILSSLKKVEKSVEGIIPSFTRLSQSLNTFYEDDPYTPRVEGYEKAVSLVDAAYQTFKDDIQKTKNLVDQYLDRVNIIKKRLSEDEKLLSKMREKEKTLQSVLSDPKADGKKTQGAQTKFDTAKKEYEEYHVETSRLLAEIVKNKGADFDQEFELIVVSQHTLFAQLATAFDLDLSSTPSSSASSTSSTSVASSLSRNSTSPSAASVNPYAAPPGGSASKTSLYGDFPSSSSSPSLNPTPPIPSSAPPSLPTSAPPPLPLSAPPSIPPSAPPPLPSSAPPSVSHSLPPSLPPSLPSSRPPSLPSSGPPSLPPSLPSSKSPSLPSSGPLSLPPSIPPSLPPSQPSSSAPPPLPSNTPSSTSSHPPRPGSSGGGGGPIALGAILAARKPPSSSPSGSSSSSAPSPHPPLPVRATSRPLPTPEPSFRGVPPPIPSHAPSTSQPPSHSPPPALPAHSPPPLPSHGNEATVGRHLACPREEREQYELVFTRECKNNQFLTGSEAFRLLSGAGLPQEHLAAIWELSDQDKDGNLTKEEFVVALYLINAKLRGIINEIPTEIPPELRIQTSSASSRPPPIPSHHSNHPPLPTRAPSIPSQQEMETNAYAYAGQQAGNAANDRDNQKAIGNAIADRSDNQAVKFLARNSYVQKHAGNAAADKANDPQFQQNVASGAKTGAREGYAHGAPAAKHGLKSYTPSGF